MTTADESDKAAAAAAEKAAQDRYIEELVARAPRMTPEQAARLRRLFRYGSSPAKRQEAS